MCPMLVTECLHNKCLNCQPCVQFIFSPGCESDMILSVMTLWTGMENQIFILRIPKNDTLAYKIKIITHSDGFL